MTTAPQAIRGLTASRIKAELCRRSLYYFIQELWDVVVQDEPHYNWHMEVLANEMQEVILRAAAKDIQGNKKEREPKLHDLLINIPPGTSKSTICSVFAPVWGWLVDPTLRFITGSYSMDVSLELAVKSRDVIRSQKFREYFPHIKLKDDKDVKSNYKNTAGGQRISTATGAGITGMHAHVIIIDDPINPKGAISQAERGTANRWMGGTLSTRKVDKRITPTVLIMQRLHEEDPSGKWLEHPEGIRHICLPGEKTEHVRPVELSDLYVDDLLDPTRMPREVLFEMRDNPERGLGSYGYAGQVLQNPAPIGGGVIKREWFPIIAKAPEEIAAWHFVIDPAYTKDQTNDPTAIMAYAAHGGNWYIRFVKSVHMEMPTLIKLLPGLVREHGYNDRSSLIRIEPKASGISLRQMLMAETDLNVVLGKPPTADKVARITISSSKMESGRVMLVAGPWVEGFLQQCTVFPNGKHDDEVDCLSMALEHKEVRVT